MHSYAQRFALRLSSLFEYKNPVIKMLRYRVNIINPTPRSSGSLPFTVQVAPSLRTHTKVATTKPCASRAAASGQHVGVGAASGGGRGALGPRQALGCGRNRCVAPLIVSPALGRLCPTPTSANTFCFSPVRARRARGCGSGGAAPPGTASPEAGPGIPQPPPAPLGPAAAAERRFTSSFLGWRFLLTSFTSCSN